MKKTTLLLSALLASAPVEGARDFTKNTSNYLSLGANSIGPLIGAVGGISIGWWMYKDTTSGSDWEDPYSFLNGNAASISAWHTQLAGAYFVYLARTAGDGYTKNVIKSETTTGSWNQFLMVIDWSANPYAVTIYKNGSSVLSSTVAATGGNFAHTSGTFHDMIGCYSASTTGVPAGSTFQIDGGIAEMAVWNKPLPAGDAVALGGGASPTKVQPQSIVAYWKLNGQGSPEIETFNRLQGTITGSIPVRDHPPIR